MSDAKVLLLWEKKMHARVGTRPKLYGAATTVIAIVTAANVDVAHAQLAPVPPANQVGQVAGQNAAQNVMGNSIDTVCPTLVRDVNAPGSPLVGTDTQDLQRVCTSMVRNAADLNGGNAPDALNFGIAAGDDYNGALQSIAGEEAQTPQLETAKLRQNQVAGIRGRLTALRAAAGSSPLSIATFDYSREYQVAQSGDDDLPILEESSSGRLGVFLTSSYRFGDKDDTDEVEGFDFDSAGIVAGVDYRLTPNAIAGIAFGYSALDVDFDSTINSPSDQSLDNDTYSLAVYGTYYAGQSFFVDGILRGGYGDYDSERHIFIPNPGGADIDNDGNPDGDIDRTAKGDFDSWFVDIGVRGGYDIALGGPVITPSIAIDYVYAEIDDYTESGAQGLDLAFDDQEAESLTTTIGATASYPISMDFGVLTPSVNAAWIFELSDDDDGVEFEYANDPTGLSRFEVAPEDKEDNFGELGASLALALPNDFSAFVDYSTVVAFEDLEMHSFFVGLRKGF